MLMVGLISAFRRIAGEQAWDEGWPSFVSGGAESRFRTRPRLHLADGSSVRAYA